MRTPPEPRARSVARWVPSIAITAGTLAAAAWFVDPAALAATLGETSVAWIAAAVAVYSNTVLVSVLRIRHLTGTPEVGRIPIRRLLGVEYVSTAFAYLLPLGVGEVARAAVWRQRAGVSFPRIGRVLVLLRAVDVLWLALAGIAAWGAGAIERSPWVDRAMLAVGALAVALAGALALFAWRGERILGAAARRLGWSLPEPGPPPGPRTWLAIAGFATLYWTSDFVFFWCLGRSVVPDLSPARTAGVFLLAGAFALLPVRGLADAGSHEVAWGVPLGLAGDPAEALRRAAATHVLVLAILLGLGVVGAALSARRGSPSRAPAPGRDG